MSSFSTTTPSIMDLALNNNMTTSVTAAKARDRKESTKMSKASKHSYTHGVPLFMFAGHHWLGNAINLTDENGRVIPAKDYPFGFYNGQVELTYGQINGLAGDFYGTEEAISGENDSEDDSLGKQIIRFKKAYLTMAEASPAAPNRQPWEINQILRMLAKEVKEVEAVYTAGGNPSKIYPEIEGKAWELEMQAITLDRPAGQRTYAGLTWHNFDHFGEDAETAYNAGHTLALRTAGQGDLDQAYRLNAFADHFLEDRFAAGHLRTPRRALHGNYFWDSYIDFLAMYMHDEDNAIGLSVTNKRGDGPWTAFGDTKLLDHDNKQNREYCQEAIQLSANEVYKAYTQWKEGNAGWMPASFGVWDIAPMLESANSESQKLCPLFRGTVPLRRLDIDNRTEWKFTKDWSYLSTLDNLQEDPKFKYPITIN